MDRIPNGENGLDPPGAPKSIIISCQEFPIDIGNGALRMRSDSFQARPDRTHAQKIGRTNPEDRERFARRAEALCALIAEKRGNESGVAGIEWAQQTLDANDRHAGG